MTIPMQSRATQVRARPEVIRAVGLWPPSAGIIRGALLGGIATAAGMALTATSGWLIVRADEGPQIMLLLTAIVAVRTFGLARPVFRYWERLRSHDDDYWASHYLGYLADRPDSVSGALRVVASSHGATVVHCAAGKDRTGFAAALILKALGVADDLIVEDYLLTNRFYRRAEAGLSSDMPQEVRDVLGSVEAR